ncbi:MULTISPECIES: YpmA family protein [Marinococcus]|jgi:hypothetical protein|uniref:DUF4264 domain-containing protein n=2 Tax=Marinococcus TaxID=1370 RepID=A0A1H2RAK4_9BACI|nr:MULTISPECIES: YpmA family protein [Marinococcus]MDX6152974.1 YpmA family protein [Marinococcus sp. PL1-022]MDZ5782285.1 YpmA family protein [Marinococcus luteus]OZT80822.1 DUF4264 domain-containing protein [Marinococcus halophilus]SDW16503.1 Protein of unknown function [Marinococcus luteus]GEK57874.1 hypothetical protein MHA01_07790 [Marinococcus halophilus]
MGNEQLEVVASVKIEASSDLYKIVDTLNRTLKQEELMFGLSLDKENEEQMVFTIYRT